jgi:protein TonB
MFEDSTFETMGRIQTRSRGWMMATLAFNSSILLALVIIPIIHPEMLPQITNAILMEEPAPVEEQRPVVRTEQVTTARTETPDPIQVPTTIPKQTYTSGKPEEPTQATVAALGPARAARIIRSMGVGRIPTCGRPRRRQRSTCRQA